MYGHFGIPFFHLFFHLSTRLTFSQHRKTLFLFLPKHTVSCPPLYLYSSTLSTHKPLTFPFFLLLSHYFFQNMLSPSPSKGQDSGNDVLPVDSLGLPMMTQPPNLFASLYERQTSNFSSFSTSATHQQSTNNLEYVPYYSLTSHPLMSNPLFYFDVHSQQFLPYNQPLLHGPLFTLPDQAHTTTNKFCKSCNKFGHAASTSKKCDNYR